MKTNESQLMATERSAIKSICIDPNRVHEEDKFPPCSDVERIKAKQRRWQLTSAAASYIDWALNPASSCKVERLFSAATFVNSCLQKHMSPILFESLLFLKLKRIHWDLKMVAAGMKIHLSERYLPLDIDEFYHDQNWLDRSQLILCHKTVLP